MTEQDSTSRVREEGESVHTIEDGQKDDLYFTSAGFEERALSATEHLDREYQAEWGLIYVNDEYFDQSNSHETISNLEQIHQRLEQHCDHVDVIKGSWLKADEQLYALREGFAELSGRSTLDITADVTTFNREALMVSFNVLFSLSDETTVRVLYTSPEEYGGWLSKGHREVRNIIGFAGIQDSNKPTLLMMLSGFEDDRAINTIEELEPAKILAGTGDPPTRSSFLDRNERKKELIMSNQDCEQFRFPTDSIDGSYEEICELINEYLPDYNIVLSPMSTKLSTLGVWRAARRFQEVQVIYTIPAKYNEEGYSTGSGSLYIDWV